MRREATGLLIYLKTGISGLVLGRPALTRKLDVTSSGSDNYDLQESRLFAYQGAKFFALLYRMSGKPVALGEKKVKIPAD